MGARKRLEKLGYRSALGEERFDGLVAELERSYQPDTPLRPYQGFIVLGPKEFVKFETMSRTAFSARAEVVEHFGIDRFIQMVPESFRDASERESDTQVELEPIPFSHDMLMLMTERRSDRRLRDATKVGAKPDDGLEERVFNSLQKRYTESAPLEAYWGWVIVQGEKVAFRTMARVPAAVGVIATAAFGPDLAISSGPVKPPAVR